MIMWDNGTIFLQLSVIEGRIRNQYGVKFILKQFGWSLFWQFFLYEICFRWNSLPVEVVNGICVEQSLKKDTCILNPDASYLSYRIHLWPLHSLNFSTYLGNACVSLRFWLAKPSDLLLWLSYILEKVSEYRACKFLAHLLTSLIVTLLLVA